MLMIVLGMVVTIACQFVAALLNPLAAPSLVFFLYSPKDVRSKAHHPELHSFRRRRHAHAKQEKRPVKDLCASKKLWNLDHTPSTHP